MGLDHWLIGLIYRFAPQREAAPRPAGNPPPNLWPSRRPVPERIKSFRCATPFVQEPEDEVQNVPALMRWNPKKR